MLHAQWTISLLFGLSCCLTLTDTFRLHYLFRVTASTAPKHWGFTCISSVWGLGRRGMSLIQRLTHSYGWIRGIDLTTVCIRLQASLVRPHFLRFSSHRSAISQYELGAHTQKCVRWHKQLADTQPQPSHLCRICVLPWVLLGGPPSGVKEFVLSAGSQDSAGVSSAQKQSQGPVNNHSRRTRGQINTECMYFPSTGCKIFLII